MNNIICVLSVKPCIKVYNFFKEMKLQTNYEIFIVIDDNNYDIPDYDGFIKIIKIDNKLCEEQGYKSTLLSLNNKACSRDKALYYFNNIYTEYDYIFFVEEDVFIPNIFTIKNINDKYITGDLLVGGHNIITEYKNNWHWSFIHTQMNLNLPYANSMICAIRCSKKMMNSIKEYAIKYNNLFMDEALFNTLAIHNNLEVKTIYELKDIVYCKEWELNEISINHLYHPIKNIEQQYNYREKLKYCNNNIY
jgi:hypothetical protein